MLLDNENKHPKVHEWISSETQDGNLDIVTGYFTIGALAWLSKTTNDNVDAYRFILGDIVNLDIKKDSLQRHCSLFVQPTYITGL